MFSSAFASVLLSSVKSGGQSIARKHTSLVFAKRFVEGATYDARASKNGKEYGILVRPKVAKNYKITPTVTTAQAPKQRGGAKRFPVLSVTLTTNGTIGGVAKLHSNVANALAFVNQKNRSAWNAEHAIILRTETRDGSFPSVEG